MDEVTCVDNCQGVFRCIAACFGRDYDMVNTRNDTFTSTTGGFALSPINGNHLNVATFPVAERCDDSMISLPLWASLLVSAGLVMLSALFSGLTLGLMSLDKMTLRVLAEGGTSEERKHAKAIIPLREHSNLLLCTLLFGNTVVNAFLSILLAELSSGWIGLATSSLLIVSFGEILPQSLCTKYGLRIGSALAPVVRLFTIILCPLAWPVSKLLDLLLGEDMGNVYNINKLKRLIAIHAGTTHLHLTSTRTSVHVRIVSKVCFVCVSEREREREMGGRDIRRFDEVVQILTDRALMIPSQPTLLLACAHAPRCTCVEAPEAQQVSELTPQDKKFLMGALEYRNKSVSNVMTDINQTYCLEIGEKLDFQLMVDIYKSGFTRVPVYDTHRGNIIGILFVKDLILLDPEDEIELKSLLSFHGKGVDFVDENTPLGEVFKMFIKGLSHIMVAYRNEKSSLEARIEGDGSPKKLVANGSGGDGVISTASAGTGVYEVSKLSKGTVTGIITLEDVLEEVLQTEIVDETDQYESNASDRRIARKGQGRFRQNLSAFFDVVNPKQVRTYTHTRD